MSRASYLINVIAPALLIIIIGVAYQFGYITYVKDPETVDLTNALNTLEERLRSLETDLGNLGNTEETRASIDDLEQRLDGVQKILESVNQDAHRDAEVVSDRHLYVTERDMAIFLMLGGLSILQIGLVTSIFFLFRRMRNQSSGGNGNAAPLRTLNDDAKGDAKNNNANSTGDLVNDTPVINST